MAKKNTIKKQEEELEVFDFSDMGFDDYDDASMFDAMSEILEVSNKQMMIAIELTKLIVANSPVENMEKHVFSVFEKATKVVAENSPLKNILEKLEQ